MVPAKLKICLLQHSKLILDLDCTMSKANAADHSLFYQAFVSFDKNATGNILTTAIVQSFAEEWGAFCTSPQCELKQPKLLFNKIRIYNKIQFSYSCKHFSVTLDTGERLSSIGQKCLSHPIKQY